MRRLKLINAIGEAIIPLMGLLFFDWGLYFILLFYFIDLVATDVFIYVKVNKIIQFQRINFPFATRFGRLILNSVLMLLVLILTHLTVFLIDPEIDFTKQIIAFLSYEEAGIPIPQGYILLPLVIFGNYQQYKMTFLKTGLFQRLSWKNLIFSRRKAIYIAIIGALLAALVAYFITIPEFIYVLLIVVVKFYVDLNLSEG